MKILDKVYPALCPICGIKNLVALPTKNDCSIKSNTALCPNCKKDVEYEIIGSVDMIDENGLIDSEHGKFMRIHYTHKPIKQPNGKWVIRNLKDSTPDFKTGTAMLTL
jgi:hypothetical protein